MRLRKMNPKKASLTESYLENYIEKRKDLLYQSMERASGNTGSLCDFISIAHSKGIDIHARSKQSSIRYYDKFINPANASTRRKVGLKKSCNISNIKSKKSSIKLPLIFPKESSTPTRMATFQLKKSSRKAKGSARSNR